MLSDFLTSSARRHLCSHIFVTNALRLLWVVFVIGGELGVFFWSLSGCRWPSIDLGHVGTHSHSRVARSNYYLEISYSSKSKGRTCLTRRWYANSIRYEKPHHPAQLVGTKHEEELACHFKTETRRCDISRRHACQWKVSTIIRRVRALRCIVLPERLQLTCIRYKQAAKKFKSIFSLNRKVPIHYIVGNNDVGCVELVSHDLCYLLSYLPSLQARVSPFHYQKNTVVLSRHVRVFQREIWNR